MLKHVTPEQVLEAAESLDQAEFSRDELAERLGVERSDLRQSFQVARRSGQVERVRYDEDGNGMFRLTGRGPSPPPPAP